MAEFMSGGDRVCLVVYPDESWGVRRNGETIRTWGPDGMERCIMAFVRMGGFDPSITGMGMAEFGVDGERELKGVSPALLSRCTPLADPWGFWVDWDDYRFN